MTHEHHPNRTRLFAIVFVLLVILTGISFAVANSPIMDQPIKGWTAMMLISIAKALLVIIFFMHLKWETNWKYVLTIPAAVMSCLLALILIPDIGNRTQTYSAERQKFAAFELDRGESLAAPPPATGEGMKKKETDHSHVPQAETPQKVFKAAGNWGTFKGQFVVRGELPEPQLITPDKDQNACKNPMVSRKLVVSPQGGLKNVVVFLTPPKEKLPVHPYYEQRLKLPVEIDNRFCRFEPHIVLLTTTQALRVKNSDQVGHNANTSSFHDENSHNQAIPSGGQIDFKLSIPESRPIPVACTSHGWMKAHVMVRDEPYMAVSNDQGEFEIKYFPAGKWQVQFWHENAGYLKGCTADGKVITQGRKGLVDIEISNQGVLDLGRIELDVSTVLPR